MRGRTNVSGGGEGINLGADVQEFTVADGSNIVAGNFVQYRIENSDQKYDTSYGYKNDFFDSNNSPNKVIPCGSNRYVMRYVNIGDSGIYWFNLVDVSNGFNVLSAISISNSYEPSFCLMNDGKLAVCYSEKEKTFTVRIYDIKSRFDLFRTFELTDEGIGNMGRTHIAQLGNSKTLISSYNDVIVCNYENGSLEKIFFKNIQGAVNTNSAAYERSETDWSVYATGENLFLMFQMNGSYDRYICLFSVEGENISLLSSQNLGRILALNEALWGNAFAINGKILFSDGHATTTAVSSTEHCYEYYNTRIFYKENSSIMSTSKINLLNYVEDIFSGLGYNAGYDVSNASSDRSSGTAQYVKEDVFYIAVLPSYKASGVAYFNNIYRVAIARVEYNPSSKTFAMSNVVTFELDEGTSITYRFGYGKFFESDKGDVYYLYETSRESVAEKNGRWLLRMTYKNGVLEKGANTQYVENYSGNAAIGVAKQSGKSGQTIEVYVPTPV